MTEQAEVDVFGTLLCGGLVVLVIVLVVLLVVRRTNRTPAGRRPGRAGAPDPYSDLPTARLAADANALLVATDDAVTTSEEELGFAAAQYGKPATAEFEAALAGARQEIAQAFRLRQQLDDEIPEDEPTRRRMLIEIITRCQAADRALDEQAAAFDELRDLETRVEAEIDTVNARHAEVTARLDGAGTALAGMRQQWAPAAFATVAGNLDQAGDRLAFATEALEEAGAAVAGGDRAAGAVAVRGAAEATGQAGTLLDAIDTAARDLAAARAAIDPGLAELAVELAAGRAAAAAADSPTAPQLAAAVAKAEQVDASVREQLGSPSLDPLAALRRLEAARAELDQALAGVRDAAQRAERARATLDQAMLTAQAGISAAGDFITTRRGAVGTEARTRLAEARRHLELATGLQGDDPVTALAHAQQAATLAELANQAARADVSGWGSQVGAPAGGGDGLGGVGALGGAVLGGILLEAALGGGARRRGPGRSWGGRVPAGFGGTRSRARYGRRR